MNLSQNLNLAQKQQLVLNQKMEQRLEILTLPIIDLEQAIYNELESNPAHELTEEKRDEFDSDFSSNDTQSETLDFSEKNNQLDESYKDLYDYDIYNDNYYVGEQSSDFDIFTILDTGKDIKEYLIEQLHLLSISKDEIEIGENILGYLNDDGYLPEDILDISVEKFDISFEKAEKVLSVLQKFEPPGICARNIQECFLLQANFYYPYDSDLTEIITEHLELLTKNKLNDIAKLMSLDLDDLKKEIEKIRKMSFKPALRYEETKVDYIRPDCYVDITEDDEFIITINDYLPRLSISHNFESLIGDSKNSTLKKFVKKSINDAKIFINAISDRKDTLKKVVAKICEKQQEFFLKKNGGINPLKYSDIAEELGHDESTISRTVNGKYMQTPYGIFPLKYFFAIEIGNTGISNKDVKTALQEIVENENKSKPYNDLQIVEELKKLGYAVSRRTVNKYRDALGIPAARLRKKY